MRIVITFLFILNLFHSNADHIVGGEMYYDYLGNNNYRFHVIVYRDCNSTGAEFDNPLTLSVYTQGSILVRNVNIPFPGSVVLPVIFNNPCVIPPNDICIEKAVYSTVINLPPTVGGYSVSYQRCCRSQIVNNIINPDATGLTWTSQVTGNNSGALVNSSPRFTNYPPLLLCNNDDLVFDHSATDPDGDQLVYSLVAPASGASQSTPYPVPAPPPPYAPIIWRPGFNAANPLGPGATISINPTTGLLTASPQMLGIFVVGVRVQEYRNGVLIGQTVRDFLFKVFNCNITMQAILPAYEQLPTFDSYCQGLNVQFVNNSYGANNYVWNFGVPGITNDISTAFAPNYTYPAPGIYQVQLIANPGWPCTDTAYMTVNVNEPIDVSFSSNDSMCILNNNYDFVGSFSGPSNATLNWDFGPNASVSTSSALNVSDVVFNTSGNQEITLSANTPYCNASFTDFVYVFPEPNLEISLPSNYKCEGLTVNFGNNSTGSTFYHWDFGILGSSTDTSNMATPTFTFPAGGNYTVTMTGGSTSICRDTITALVEVNELLTVNFTNNDSLCILNNSFNFDGTMTGPNFTTFVWDFGPQATPMNATTLDVNGVSFNTFGTIPVTLTGSFNSCTESITKTIFIYREPTIDFSVAPGPWCAPAVVPFTDLSIADSPIYYSWDFGDMGSSSQQNPNHVYTQEGQYSVSLTIRTDKGCVDTITLVKPDIVTVHPSPVSAFEINPKATDICNSLITFSDLSIGASSIFYFFDDGPFTGQEGNTSHEYLGTGWLRPMQVATNEFGCRDTSYQELYIEPFIIYIPNTFTPDQNEFNNIFKPLFALEVEDWNFKIFNRWGTLLFESTNDQVGWDGTYDGTMMQDGVYTYILEYKSCEHPDFWQKIEGHVNLLR